MIDPVILGRRLHDLRADRGLAFSALAKEAGVSVSMLSAIERGEKTPTVVVLSRIADGLGLSLSRLLADLETDRVIVRRAADQDHVAEPGGWHRTVLTRARSPPTPRVPTSSSRSSRARCTSASATRSTR
jgi:transcriptional regulator with XRE-family HTH domain